ncbi:uncharacterized protein LOC116932512 [Daphnia magna]|uniref:uncharacterized protein LOC116932512 n=1 Tax=Daphnia magna TaxID=35525 RepID=UPI001E1BD87D|nr:uncharacterized protein LOC116932512 [Daphnia magna]
MDPLESSDDECELFSDDDGTKDAWCDDELTTGIQLVDDVPARGFKEKLASWAVEYRVKQNAVDGLLNNVLPTMPDYDKLNIPKSCKTLLKTMKKTPLKEVEPGQYYHFGLARRIQYMLDRYGGHLTESLDEVLIFLINADGLPLAKASGCQVWPIQCRFFNSLMEKWPPFLLGVYQGNSKPANANDYLEDFVNEALQLQHDGFFYRGKVLKIVIFGFSCDAPANALMKAIKIHNGYECCPKCVVHGKWAGRVVLLETCSPLRNDKNFRNKTHDGHHTGTSILEQLDIDMISVFAIDYIHCVCLGVMRKLLWIWIRGPLAIRIGRQNIDLISDALMNIVDFIPSDFSRKPRSLAELARWKATELRQFLLYTGPAVLKNIFKGTKQLEDFYNHFMLLHTAIKILSSPHLCQETEYNKYAKDLLILFVEQCKSLYGDSFISYNFHCLIHLADDVIRFGALDRYSSFTFENNMKTVKAMVRKHECVLAQIVRRMCEQETYLIHSNQMVTGKTLLKIKHTSGPI